MFEIIIVSVIILLICFALLGVAVIFKKGGRFPQTHVGGNKALQEKGIKCARTQDFEAGIRKNLFDRMAKEV